MTDPTSTRRSFCPTPAWLVLALLVVEGLLWLSERFGWFWFNEKKGWTVLVGVAVVGAATLVMLGWFIASVVFRWRFQFSIRSLLVLTVAVAMPCSWLAVKLQQANRQKRAVEWVAEVDGLVTYDYQTANSTAPGPKWLRQELGEDFFSEVVALQLDRMYSRQPLPYKIPWELLSNADITDVGLTRLEYLPQLQELKLDCTQIGDAGLEHMAGLTQLRVLVLNDAAGVFHAGTQITNVGLFHLQRLTHLQRLCFLSYGITNVKLLRVTAAGWKKLQEALPNCRIEEVGFAASSSSASPQPNTGTSGCRRRRAEGGAWLIRVVVEQHAAFRVDPDNRRVASDLPCHQPRSNHFRIEPGC